MLYKKYHRKYVSRFKKGAKFRYREYEGIIEIKPWWSGRRIYINVNWINWTLVFPNGRLERNIFII